MIDVEFSRQYINNRSYRTAERKQKIKEALKSLTGETINAGCSTCYIEAILKILKMTKMANYELKRGVLLQEFGFPEKACTNLTLTDELAIWHLSRHPEKAVYFARIPADFVPSASVPPPPPPPPPAQRRNTGDKYIIAPEKIIFPKEDQAERKLLVEKAIELGFKSSPENPIEMISVEQLRTIIPNLEKAKEEIIETAENQEIVKAKPKKKTVKSKK